MPGFHKMSDIQHITSCYYIHEGDHINSNEDKRLTWFNYYTEEELSEAPNFRKCFEEYDASIS